MAAKFDDDLTGGHVKVSALLFLCLFASQASLIALSPVLADVANDFDVSTAAAGQLRTVAGVAAGITALSLGRVGRRLGLGGQLLAAAALLAVGSAGSAAAPNIELLALAQVPVGIGVAVMTTAGTVAAAAWVPAEQRTRVLAWALVGQPAAWIVGMPLIGLVGERSWRYACLVLPLAAAVVAVAALVPRASEPPAPARSVSLRRAVADSGLTRWLAAESLANTAWAGTLVYAGALFVDSYGASARLTGVLLAIGAAAYLAGNLAFRRFAAAGSTWFLPVLLLALAATTALFGALRPSPVTSTLLFSAAAFSAGGRTLISSAAGLTTLPELRTAVMGARAASLQFGYFAGSLACGAALSVGGYGALGLVVSLVFVAAAGTVTPLPRLFGPSSRWAGAVAEPAC